MKRMIKYNSIKDFGTAVKNLKFEVQNTGEYDEDNHPIVNRLAVMPTLLVKMSEKIHGTNAGACYSEPDGFWVQSRERILDRNLEKDNAACAYVGYGNENTWINIIKKLADNYNISLNKYIVSIYYEWSGGSIQKNSALSGLEKKAIIFQHFKVSPIEPVVDEFGERVSSEEQPAYWLETKVDSEWIEDKEFEIYNIMNFKHYELEIDFEKAILANNTLIELIEKNEMNSPVGQAFGIDGNIAEGIVGTFEYKDTIFKFKVKGEKHANSKVKILKPVDNEKEQRKIDLAQKVTTALRCEQAWQVVHGIDNEIKEPEKKNVVEFLRWVHGDVMKECLDDYREAKLEPKEINGQISKIAKLWFFEQLEKHELS